MDTHVTHPLLKPGSVERRLYQEVIVAQVEEKGNTLVVAPTALGKTVIAAMLCARMLEKNPHQKILFLAPTKPLAVQHQTRLREFLTLHPETINVLTGALSPEKRAQVWNESSIITATPQTIENDLLTGKSTLQDVQLLIFDEAHRSVKEYSYVYLAKVFWNLAKQDQHKRILALTASPGSSEEEIQDICKNLFIQHIVVKTLQDEDVKPYVNDINVEWKKVTLPNEFYEIKNYLQKFLHEQLVFFKKIGYARNMHSNFIRRTDLLQLQSQLREDMIKYGTTKPQLYQAVSRAAAVMKVSHAVTLLESQGIHALHEYFEKLQHNSKQVGSPKAAGLIANHEDVKKAFALEEKLHTLNVEHPKLALLKQILQKQFDENPESRVLVFNHYRDSVGFVTEELNKVPTIQAARFIGQATKSVKDKGLSQKKQIALLEEFREGKHNVLVASSVAEEGLDIPSVDLVIFYEPVPSEIRLIQRRGRTGRKAEGRVIILMAEKTMDEGMYWAAKRKEKNMHETLQRLSTITSKGSKHAGIHASNETRATSTTSNTIEKGQSTLFQHTEESENIFIFADTREQASSVLRELSFFPDVRVHTKTLEVGDFVIGPDVVIERKTTEDFLSSVIDGRLLGQLMNMSQAYARPLLLLEGKPEDLFTLRNMHENAIIGMLSTIALTYRIPIFFTKNAHETAKYIRLMAKREQLGNDKEIRLRVGRKGFTLNEQQQFLVESLPGIGPTVAKTLLEHFGSIQKIVNASKDELKEVENIGPKKAQTILDVITKPYEKDTRKKNQQDTHNKENEFKELDTMLSEEMSENTSDENELPEKELTENEWNENEVEEEDLPLD
ncbi:MAG: DEAD/DEAH box helicase [Candidatus Diapherotrites archaeon]|uniref:DEAD/DEAH box helicase n=1 Tax=Candidatus Iainarchaeum sp. TaxID=3101447 RepID=A0A8T4C6P2_9ARCH|nr:DEAD/DEAH box helicase [Candidatus Diapherotrites archaeon]